MRGEDGRLRVADSFEHFKVDFGISLTAPSGGRPGMLVYPVFEYRRIRIRPNRCFVIMPFDDLFGRVYRESIKPAVTAGGRECRRADDIFSAGPIMERIWRYLVQSPLVIADLTSRNANVLYELGIAHALGREVILLTQEPGDIPFDLRHHRWLKYSTKGVGLAQLRAELTGAIQDIEHLES